MGPHPLPHQCPDFTSARWALFHSSFKLSPCSMSPQPLPSRGTGGDAPLQELLPPTSPCPSPAFSLGEGVLSRLPSLLCSGSLLSSRLGHLTPVLGPHPGWLQARAQGCVCDRHGGERVLGTEQRVGRGAVGGNSGAEDWKCMVGFPAFRPSIWVGWGRGETLLLLASYLFFFRVIKTGLYAHPPKNPTLLR